MTWSARAVAAVLLVVIVFLAQAVFYSRTLVPSENENSYLGLGLLTVTGQISLYQDELTGQRLPLPFYVFGTSQVLFGRNLWAGRLLSIVFGSAVLVLTMFLARRLAGPLAGWLAGLLLATQGAVVSYYSIAAYHAWSALLLVGAVTLLILGGRNRAVYGMAAAALTPVSRTNMIGAVPYLWMWALRIATSTRQRILATLVVVAPFVLFLAYDTRHVKLLAHIPLLKRLVAALGYRSIVYFEALEVESWTTQLWSLVRFARRFESWALAAGVILLMLLLLALRGARLSHFWSSNELAVAGLAAWMLAWHCFMFWMNLKWVIAYFPDFAPLFAIVLGTTAARLLGQPRFRSYERGLLVGGLALACVVSVVFVRSPMMPRPIPRPFVDDSVQRVERAAAKLATIVPPGERVFLVGPSIGVYLAGRIAYLQQMMAPGTLVARDGETELINRSGVWGRVEIDRWLGEDVRYAVVTPTLLEGLKPSRPDAIGRIETLLRDRFERIAVLDDEPTTAYDVYRRRDVKAGS
jgi:4-amino-4-deoxy-L-arabinose transferase-like glycosyltransferase